MKAFKHIVTYKITAKCDFVYNSVINTLHAFFLGGGGLLLLFWGFLNIVWF